MGGRLEAADIHPDIHPAYILRWKIVFAVTDGRRIQEALRDIRAAS